MKINEIVFLDTHKWGGSGIESACFEFILKTIEIGAGVKYINIYDEVNYMLQLQEPGMMLK
jgi:hypothetical protein